MPVANNTIISPGKEDFKLTKAVIESTLRRDVDLARVFAVTLDESDSEQLSTSSLEDSFGGLDINGYLGQCNCEHCAGIQSPLDLCCIHSLAMLRELVSKQQQLQHHQLQRPKYSCITLLLEDPLCLSVKLSYVSSFNSLPFKLLTCGRNDSIRQVLGTLGPEGINSHLYQGMTPLMCAANAGDYNLVSLLLDSDAHPNIAVPAQLDNTQVIPVETRKWTALSFAVLQGHTDIVKLMLSRGAAVEGSMNNPADLTTETPLQLAAAAGDIAIVELLLEKGADPFLCSTANNLCTTRNRGGSNAIALAVAHGHVSVRHKLLQHQPSVKSNDMLSLQEILAEGYLFQNNRAHGIRLSRLRKLQEALYLACEHGYLNIALELRSIGVMWNLNFWTRCLETAFEEGNMEIVKYLLNDYECLRVEEFSSAFCKDGIVLLFEIFKACKSEDIVLSACKMLQHCYGVFQWKPITGFKLSGPEPRIGNTLDLGGGLVGGTCHMILMLSPIHWSTAVSFFWVAL
eukprot:sb/3463920/